MSNVELNGYKHNSFDVRSWSYVQRYILVVYKLYNHLHRHCELAISTDDNNGVAS